MKIGVIWVGFQTEDYVRPSSSPWIAAREHKLCGHEFLIAAVSVPFQGFDVGEHDNTRVVLHEFAQMGKIDWLIAHDTPMKETDARGEALRWLVAQGVTHVWQHDSDEFITVQEIAAIIRFIEARPHVDWFRLSLKNQVFTPSQYLVEPFTPPRIHRVDIGGYQAHSFYQDNNILYGGKVTRDLKPDMEFPHCLVPKSVAWIRHASWLNNSRSRAKCAYQAARWGADKCTFAWDDSKGGLIFNPAMPAPEIAREGTE